MVIPFIRTITYCIPNSIYVSDSIMEDPIRDTVNDTSLKNSMVQDLDGSIVNNASLKNSLVQDLDGKILNNTNLKNSMVQDQNGSIVKDASLKDSMVQDLDGNIVKDASLKNSMLQDLEGSMLNNPSLKDSMVQDLIGSIVNSANNLMVDDLQLNEAIDKMPQTDKSRENDENVEHLIKDLLGGCGDEWEWMETAIAYVLSDIYGLSTMRKLASLDLQSAVTTSNLWFTLYLAEINRDEALNEAVEVFLLDRLREARSKKASGVENPSKIQKVCSW